MKNELPKGWEIKKLGEVCKIVLGSTPSTENPKYWDGDIFWATPKDLGKLESIEIYHTERKITKEGLESCSSQLLPKGTVLLTTRAPIGHVAIAGVEITTNQGFKNLVCSNNIYNRFLYFLLKCFVLDLQSLGRGATFTEISKKKVENFEIPRPPLPEQKRIVAKIEELFEKIDKAKKLREEAIKETKNLIHSALEEIFSRAEKERWKRTKLGNIVQTS